MCIADLAISRRCHTDAISILPATPVILKPNPDRVALYITTPRGGGVQVVVAAGQTQYSNAAYFIDSESTNLAAGNYGWDHRVAITYLTHPGLIHNELVVYSTAAGYAIEVTMNDDLANELRQYLKEQRSAFARRG